MKFLNKTPKSLQDNNEELKQERELYADLANASPSGIYRLRVLSGVAIDEGKWSNPNEAPYVVEFVNDRFCEILTMDKLAFTKKPGSINDLIYDADKADFASKNVAANRHHTPFIWDGRFNIKNKIIWVHFESVPRVLPNNDIIWTGTLNDITDRKIVEQEIINKNEELQKLNAEKDKFFSIIAHDLKSPFNSVIGFSDLLATEVMNKNYDNIELYSDIIKSSSTRAVDLLMNLMEWSQSQTGRMDFNPEYFDLDVSINEIVLLFTNIAIQKSIIINYDTDSKLLVYADKAMINTIVRNLVSNAIKFTKPGGSVTIIIEVVPNNVKITVKDSGIGMSKSTIEKLFRIDTNYKTTGTNDETGTGLGLILCKEFINKHNGEILVESEPGKGSVFCFSIPGISALLTT